MKKEILTPFSDSFLPDAFNVRKTNFQLGPVVVEVMLKDNKYCSQEMGEFLNNLEDHRTGERFEPKQYLLMCIINDADPYVLGNFDNKKEA